MTKTTDSGNGNGNGKNDDANANANANANADADADNHGVIFVPSNISTEIISIDRAGKTIEIGRAASINNSNDDASSGASASSTGWGDGEQSTSTGTYDTGNTSSNKGGGSGLLADDDQSFNFARKEDRAVSFWRIFMLCVLVLTTISVAVIVYTFVDSSERYEFELSFEDDTLKIYESLGSSMDKKLAAVDSLAMLMVSSAIEKNETFPFTSFTDFAVKAAKVSHGPRSRRHIVTSSRQ